MYITLLFLKVYKIIAERNVNKKTAVQALLHSVQPHMLNVTPMAVFCIRGVKSNFHIHGRNVSAEFKFLFTRDVLFIQIPEA